MADCKICMKAIEALRGHTLHGRWERGICTICGFDLRELTDDESELGQWVWEERLDYCPKCGTKMDGDESEID